MNTDTPRTDARLFLLENEHDDVAFESLSDFARQLEKERDEAQDNTHNLWLSSLAKAGLIDHLEESITHYCDGIVNRLDSLRSALAQAEADTKRLDWLEKNWDEFDPIYTHVPYPSKAGPLRAAIDAALATQKGEAQ